MASKSPCRSGVGPMWRRVACQTRATWAIVAPMSTSLSGLQLSRLLGSWRSTGPTGPGYDKLATGIRALVLDGRVPLSAQLPAERVLAESLEVSRTTVAAAYDRLRDEGFL